MDVDWTAPAVFVGLLALILALAWLAAGVFVALGIWRGARRVDEVDVRERLEPYTNVRVIRTGSTSDGHVTTFPVDGGEAS